MFQRWVDQEQDRQFPHLPRLIDFFTDMDNDQMAGIQLGIGATEERWTESYPVNFPGAWGLWPKAAGVDAPRLFAACVSAFAPSGDP